MELIQRNGIQFFQFPGLKQFENLRHAVFTRCNGHSQTPYHSLNTSLGVGDRWEVVRQNRTAIAGCLGSDNLSFLRQVHGKTICAVTEKDRFDAFDQDFEPPVGDALITETRNRYLCIQVADCQPLLLYDPVKKTAANVHIGWRGSVQNIAAKVVDRMHALYHSDPGDIHAGIGPSLGPCCAEFVNYKSELPEAFRAFQRRPYHFDFWEITRDQLTRAGVPHQQIAVSGLCTKCRTDLFFSYRGEGVTGRFTAVIGLT